MAAGTPGGRRHLVEPKEIAGLASGVGPEHLTEEQHTVMDNSGLTVVRQRMRVVGLPDGTEQFKRVFLQDVVNGKPAELARALVPLEDAQASFIASIDRFPPITSISHSPAHHHMPSC